MTMKPRNPALTPKELAQKLEAVIGVLEAERVKVRASTELAPIEKDVSASVATAQAELKAFVAELRHAARAERPRAPRKWAARSPAASEAEAQAFGKRVAGG